MKLFGIDISKYQGDFDFKKAKDEGVKFVVLRGAYGTNKDTKFERNYKVAKENNLDVGVYLYTTATNEKEAIEEAYFLYEKCLKNKKFELPIYIDIEGEMQKKLSKETNTKIVKAFCKTLEKKGYYTGVYSFKSFFENNLNDNELQMYAHWLAQWTKKYTFKTQPGVLGMWQFGGSTNKIRSNKIAGVICDQDYLFIDYPTIIKGAKLNGYKNETPAINKYYKVVKGDTLTKIAKKFNTTIDNIVKLNNIRDINVIKVGQKLRIK